MADSRAELRAAAEKATPGPWRVTANDKIYGPPPLLPQFSLHEPLAEAMNSGDSAFIAAASPEVVLALLDELDDEYERLQYLETEADSVIAGLRAELEAARDVIARMDKINDGTNSELVDTCADLAEARRTLAAIVLATDGTARIPDRLVVATDWDRVKVKTWHDDAADCTVYRATSSPVTKNSGQQCRICQGRNGQHDGATHDAYVADRPAGTWPASENSSEGADRG